MKVVTARKKAFVSLKLPSNDPVCTEEQGVQIVTEQYLFGLTIVINRGKDIIDLAETGV